MPTIFFLICMIWFHCSKIYITQPLSFKLFLQNICEERLLGGGSSYIFLCIPLSAGIKEEPYANKWSGFSVVFKNWVYFYHCHNLTAHIGRCDYSIFAYGLSSCKVRGIGSLWFCFNLWHCCPLNSICVFS